MRPPVTPEREAVAIVLLGAFNPRIFHPLWFAARGLLPGAAVESSNLVVINNDLCAFQTDLWHVEVTAERFLVSSENAVVADALRDLALGTFTELHHTLVRAIGVNTSAHYPLGSKNLWDGFGHRLAPKDVLWSPVLEKPGTLSLNIQGDRNDGYAGHVRVRVDPSAAVEHGLYIDVNDEYRHAAELPAASWVPDVLTGQWKDCMERSRRIHSHLVTEAIAGRSE